MPKRELLRTLLAGLLLAVPVAGWSDVLSNYTATYQVDRDGTYLGRARFTLSAQEENCYLYQGAAKPEGLVALLAGGTTEQSHFCVMGGKIRPVSYHTQEDDKKEDSYALSFDWVNRQVRTDQNAPRRLDSDGVDPLSLQIALRKIMSDSAGKPKQPITLRVIEDDGEKDYHFNVTGHETLATPMGQVDTVRLDRTDDRRRQLRMWLAPALDYLPVRVEQQKREGAVTRMKIETLPDSPVD